MLHYWGRGSRSNQVGKSSASEKDTRSLKVARGAYWFGLAECLALTQSVYVSAERLLLAQSAYDSSRMKRSGM